MLAFARSISTVERQDDVGRGLCGAEVAGLWKTDRSRGVVNVARHVKEAARGRQRQIRGGMSCIGAGLSEGSDGDVEK